MYTLHLIPATSSPTSQAFAERFVEFWRELKVQASVAMCFLTENLFLGSCSSFLSLSSSSAYDSKLIQGLVEDGGGESHSYT